MLVYQMVGILSLPYWHTTTKGFLHRLMAAKNPAPNTWQITRLCENLRLDALIFLCPWQHGGGSLKGWDGLGWC